ncbi:hypothetical protein [Hymenobacter sp. AT01-02]|uniref:hypothetical protein n=1 Tax=Hymenobacter sp. AT01-02 TaxID=1571877 RepID=UPI000A670142|nr:hypothetical protein [Hymenobacter sp. AT01-02]
MSSLPKARPGLGWLWRMAWRDSRRSRSRLLLFISAIVLGIAALVGINGFGDNLARSINEQARELVGADLVISSTQPVRAELQPTLRGLGGTRSNEVAFASLVQFPKGRGYGWRRCGPLRAAFRTTARGKCSRPARCPCSGKQQDQGSAWLGG